MMTEADMVAGCRRGDRQAQHAVYLQTAPRIHRLLLRMTRNADDAADLTQQTFLQAFSRIGQFDGRATLATWIYRIAVTEGLQWLRRVRRNATQQSTAVVTDAPAASPAAGIDLKLDMEDALARMDPIDQTMLLLRYDAGKDYRAIAEIVNCPEGTVASRLHRARQRLRALLAGGPDAREETRAPVHRST
jgi:RNA polymerase sigma-70 factor (ECF subfamily)